MKNGLAGIPVPDYDLKLHAISRAHNTSLHYTKESLFNAMHTSYIVPKGSPLQVGQIVHFELNLCLDLDLSIHIPH